MMSSFKMIVAFLITLVSLCVTVHSQIACEISPLVLELDVSTEGMLTCSCSGTTAADEMWWCKDNHECLREAAIQNDPGHFLVSSAFGEGLLVGVLNILNASPELSTGTYYCKTKDGGSFDAQVDVSEGVVYKAINTSEANNDGIVKVVDSNTKSPQIVSTEKVPVTDAETGRLHQAPYLQMTPSENQIFNDDNDLHVQCEVVNADPTPITWYKGNTQLHTNGDYVVKGNELTIKSPRSSDAGTYSCQAIVHNNNGSALQLERFITFAEPISIKAMESIKYTEGETARVVCTATSAPLPSVTWYLNGVNITDIVEKGNTSHYQIVGRMDGPHGWKSTLRVLDLSFADTGLYNCTAFNGVIHEYKTVDLKIQDRMAAVWPFLGIVGECTFLIIVILIHEKCTEENYDDEDEYNEETIKINKKHDPVVDKSEVRDRGH